MAAARTHLFSGKPRRRRRQRPRKPAAKKADLVSEAADSVVKAMAKSKKAKTQKPTTALNAAAKIHADAKAPMTSKELLEAMAAKDLSTSPDGKTPERALYLAVARDIAKKGKASRFKKSDMGKFAPRGES